MCKARPRWIRTLRLVLDPDELHTLRFGVDVRRDKMIIAESMQIAKRTEANSGTDFSL
jgi:hypothetical protein